MPSWTWSWSWRVALSSPRHRAALRSDLLAELARPVATKAPLPEALAAAATEHPSAVIRGALAVIASRLADGEELSRALEGFERLGGAELRPVVAAAERAGALEEALLELERAAVRAERDEGRLRETWILPVLTGLVAVGAFGVLLLATLPALREYTGEQHSSPLPHRLTFPVSLSAWLFAWLGLCLAAALSPRLLPLLPSGERWMARLPFWGPLRRSATSLLFTRSLARLLGAGVGLVESLETASRVWPAGAVRAELLEGASRLSDGAPAREAFGTIGGALPPVLRALLTASDGEAELGAALERFADFEESELHRHAARATFASALTGLALAGLVAATVVLLGWTSYFSALSSTSF